MDTDLLQSDTPVDPAQVLEAADLFLFRGYSLDENASSVCLKKKSVNWNNMN